jgi:ankyrin repeat protein
MNVGNNMGETPLMIAARTNRGLIVGFLLDLRAGMAETSNSGYSAMGLALRDGALGAAEILLAANAPTTAPEGDMVNPRIDAAFRGEVDRLRQLGRMEMANFAGQTPLHAATFAGQEAAVTEILNLVENASAIPQTYQSYIVRQTLDGKTAFFVSVERNNQQLAELIADRYSGAALQTIAWAKDLNDTPDDIEDLTDAQASAAAKQEIVNTGDASGTTPIFIPLMGGNTEFAEYLAKNGADLDARMAEGFAPIHSVTAVNQTASIEWLLAKGANIETRTTNGRMPLHIAAESGAIDAMQLLLSRGAKVTEETMDRVTPLHYAAQSGSVEAVEILLANGADIASETVDGRQPLHYASESGQVDTAQFLIARGANVNARMLNGQTPLHLSANAMQPGTTDLLLSSDAETTLRDSDGRTPLYMAQAAMSVPYNSSGQAQRAINTVQPLLKSDPDLMVQRK